MTDSEPSATFSTAGDLAAYLAERARGQAAIGASRSLLDILSPLFQRTEEIAKSLRDGDGHYAGDTAHDELMALLQRSETEAGQAGMRRADIDDAVLATVAWIDEVLSAALRPGLSEAREEPEDDPFADPGASDAADQDLYRLQTTRFEISDAGIKYFEKLSALAAEQGAVREVYVAVLELGYRGQYFADDDRRQLDAIKREHAERLMSVTRRPVTVAPAPDSGTSSHSAPRSRCRPLAIAAAIALVALAGGALAYNWYSDCVGIYGADCVHCTLNIEDCFH